MESSIESQSDIFEFLCNKSNVFDYFNEFHLLLEESKTCFDFNQNSINFLNGLKYLEQNNFFDIQKCEELNSILIKIFDTLSDKYLQSVIDVEYVDSVTYGFDLIAFLIKILVGRTDQKIDLQTLQNFLTNYFQTYSVNHEKFDVCENEKELLHQSLRFLAKILKCLNYNNFLNYVTNEYLIEILQSIPLSDKFSVNIFVNQILPHLFSICKIEHKTLIIDYLWKRILSSFEANSNSNEEPYFYSLLCCLTEFAFKEHFESSSLYLHNDIIWKIIQIGLTCCSSYNRKQALYSFKMLLFFAKSENIFIIPSGNIPLFYIHSIKDLLIWNDLVALFEILEEKQIHVIKPVLPKFTRILQYASKRNSIDKDVFVLHPSWVTCFIRRMLIHESKFISKQGLSMAVDLNLKDYPMNLLNSELFIHDLFEAFNDQNMYSRMNENDNLSLFLSSNRISVFLTNFISAFDTQEQKVDFLRYILKQIASQSWCGVALLHLTFALTNLNPFPSWKSSDIMLIRKIIQHSVKAFEPIFRTAIEHWFLKSCLLLIDWNSVCLMDLSELLSIFKSFQRHTVIWNTTANKLKHIFLSESYDNLSIHAAKAFSVSFIEKMLSSSGKESLKRNELQRIAQLFMILADSAVILPEEKGKSINWPELLHPLTFLLKDAPNRPYLSAEKFYNVLQFYIFLITESHGSNKSITDDHCTVIIKCFNFSSEFLEFIYQKSIMDLKTADDIFQFQILCHALTVLSSLDGQYELFLKLLPHFLIKCNSVPQHFLSRKVIVIFFYSILNSYSSATENSDLASLSYNLLSKITSEHIIDDLSKSVCMSGVEKEIWLELASEFISEFWKITSNVVTYLPPLDLKNVAAALVQQAQNTFDGGPISAVPYAIDCIRSLIPTLGSENTQMVKSLLFSAWKACSELHGSEAYRHAVNSFTLAVFQSYMLQDKYFNVVYEYLDYFQKLSENTVGIFYSIIKQFCKVFSIQSLFKMNFNFVPILIHALTYGPIHHKGQKILEDTVAYISEHDKSFFLDNNYSKPSVFVRIIVITHLMESFQVQCCDNEKIAFMLINGLLELDDSSKRSKSSKFANSFNHRVRNRIWQAILLLHPYLASSKQSEIFLEKILNILESDNQQPSIRFLQEWIIFKVLNVHKDFIKIFISVLETYDKRPGFLISLLSILVHLIVHGLIATEDNASKCLTSLINYCMAQNFAVRLYGRLAVTKLFAFCESQSYCATVEKYDFLRNLVFQQSESVLSGKGNIYKNLIKLSEDFYFSAFHPVHHYTLETIFFELPRLSNVSSEEWIKPSYFEQCFGSFNFSVPCYNSDDSLKYCSATSWSDKTVEESVVENESFDFNFQKKICPSKPGNYIFGEDDSFTDSKPKNDLIVIASLIDRIPNLGGLCRTCEVFGVNEFIIGSLKYTEDKQFQNLAVSADKWVTIKEVKPYNLKEYLLSLKEDGYTLVGAEQTDDSHKLSDYIFPKKSAVLLGHEKEGMPVDLIQLLDACVEIPQQGIIRSLNVHVSGAIFIWEYARQQIKHVL